MAITQIVHPPPFPSHLLHPHTSAVNKGVRVKEGVWRSERGEADERDGWCYRTEGTVYLQSPCERDSGVSVFGLAESPPSLGLCLPHFLALCPRSCFSLGLFVLADTQWHLAATHRARMSARRRIRMKDTRAHQALFVLAVTRCYLLEPLNASDQPNTPPCLHLPSVDTPPSSVHRSNRAELVGFTPHSSLLSQ